jgi:hypothetical protein
LVSHNAFAGASVFDLNLANLWWQLLSRAHIRFFPFFSGSDNRPMPVAFRAHRLAVLSLMPVLSTIALIGAFGLAR